MRGRSYLLVAVVVCWLGTAAAAQADTPQANECHDPKALAKSHGRAVLELDGTRTDIPRWKSTISLDLPTSWPPAKELVEYQRFGGGFYAYRCILELSSPWGFTPSSNISSSIVVRGQTIRLTWTGEENFSGYRESRFGPWVATASEDSLIISFRADKSSALSSVSWDSFTVKADGFRLTSPEPFPTTQEEDTLVLWEKPSKAPAANGGVQLIQLLATPKPIASLKLRIGESAGSLTIVPYRVYLLVLIVILLLLLYDERRRYAKGLPKSLSATRLLALVAAALASLDLVDHFNDNRFTFGDPVSLLIIATSAVLIGNAPSGAIRRLLAVLLALVLAIVAIALSPSPLSVDPSRDLVTSALGAMCAIYLVWLLLLGAAMAIFEAPPFNWSMKLSRYRLALLLTVIYTAIYGGASLAMSFPLMRPSQVVELAKDVMPLLLLSGAVGLLILHSRQVQLLLDRYQRWVLAWLVSVVLLLVSPRYYLGISIPVAAMLGLVTTILVLRVAGNRAILARLVHAKRFPPNSLRELYGSGQQLVVAGERLNSLSAELKALQKQLSEGSISSAEYSSRRGDLEAEADGLRRLPPTMRSKVIVPSRRYGRPLPERTNPIDVALSLGPEGDIGKTGMRAGIIGLVFGLPSSVYFATQSWLPLPQGQLRFLIFDTDLFPLVSFAQQLVFWWLLCVALGAAWGSLYGRRGSTRAFQVWFCVAVPLGLHTGLNWALDQQSEANVLFRVTLLLVVLLITGSAIDLQTLRGYELSHQWDLGLFRRYYNFNRLVATVTLVLPLATAGLSLWQQIQSGVLREPPPPTRTERSAEQPQPEGAVPGSDTRTNGRRR